MTEATTRKPKKGLTYKDFYEATSKSISLQEYKRILEHFNKLFVEELVKGKKIALPFHAGGILIQKNRNGTSRRLRDFAHYHKTGEKRYFQNWHSGGYSAGMIWERDVAHFPLFSALDKRLFKIKSSFFLRSRITKGILEENAMENFMVTQKIIK